MAKRWIEVRLSEADLQEALSALSEARLTLRLIGVEPVTIGGAVRAGVLSIKLGELAELLEEGLQESESAMPVDVRQRPK